MDFTKVSMSIFAYSFVNELSNSTKLSDIVAFLVQEFCTFLLTSVFIFVQHRLCVLFQVLCQLL